MRAPPCRQAPRRRHGRHGLADQSGAGTDDGQAERGRHALRDHGRAKLVGQPTYGKGTVQTFYDLDEEGSSVKLRIYTHVREDTIALYGFATTLEQELFERLISISGIGPKLALSVLSGIETPDLVRAIKAQDVAHSWWIPALGGTLAAHHLPR